MKQWLLVITQTPPLISHSFTRSTRWLETRTGMGLFCRVRSTTHTGNTKWCFLLTWGSYRKVQLYANVLFTYNNKSLAATKSSLFSWLGTGRKCCFPLQSKNTKWEKSGQSLPISLIYSGFNKLPGLCMSAHHPERKTWQTRNSQHLCICSCECSVSIVLHLPVQCCMFLWISF